MIVLRATVEAQTGSKRIRWQISQSEVGESAEQAGIAANVLIAASDKLVGISARGRCTR